MYLAHHELESLSFIDTFIFKCVAPIVLASSICQDAAPPKHLPIVPCNGTLVQI